MADPAHRFLTRARDVVLGFNIAAMRHILRGQPRQFLRACRRAYIASRWAGQIPEIQLGDVLGERKPSLKLTVARYEDGMLPNEHLLALLSILVAESPREVLEIGTYMGRTTRAMAENLPSAVIHTLDLAEDFAPTSDSVALPKDDWHLIAGRSVGRDYISHACAERIRQHFGDSATWDFRAAGGADFFFIDGAHTYDYCRNDTEKCFELCRGRGVFLWHDCDDTHPGVVRFLAEWRRQGRDIRLIAGTSIAYWKSL